MKSSRNKLNRAGDNRHHCLKTIFAANYCVSCPSRTTTHLGQTSHELLPKKGVPTKFQLAWKCSQNSFKLGDLSSLMNTFFDSFLIYAISRELFISKFIKLACSCLINCYLQYMIGSLVIFNISIFAKLVPFQLQAG